MEHQKVLTIVSTAVAWLVASAAYAQAPNPPSLAYAAAAPAAAGQAQAASTAPAPTKAQPTPANNAKVEAPVVTAPVKAPARKAVQKKPVSHQTPVHNAVPVSGMSAEEIRREIGIYVAELRAKQAAERGNNAKEEAMAWQAGKKARPVMGADGLLMYPFGQGQPEVTCRPLHACDIQLQAGEVVYGTPILGDSVRWITAKAETGEGDQVTPHIVIKPTEPELSTNMMVMTNRRTYVLTLKSSDVAYESRVGWYYPSDMVQEWSNAAQLAQRKTEADAKRKVGNMPIATIEQLNLDGYQIRGDKSLAWHPLRVFDDGTRVWIQMPSSIRSSEAPALVLLDKSGASELVNYRVKEAEQGGTKVTYYIVDKLFERAGLIVGVGSDQKKVEITKAKAPSWSSNWNSRYGD